MSGVGYSLLCNGYGGGGGWGGGLGWHHGGGGAWGYGGNVRCLVLGLEGCYFPSQGRDLRTELCNNRVKGGGCFFLRPARRSLGLGSSGGRGFGTSQLST